MECKGCMCADHIDWSARIDLTRMECKDILYHATPGGDLV